MQITIGSVSLTGDVPAENVQDFRLVSESQVQQVQPINAAGISQILRGNKRITITFTISREQTDSSGHASAELAAYFCLQHESQFPLQDKLTYTTDSGTIYLLGAVAVVTQGSFAGCTTTHSYRITAGGYSTSDTGYTAPASLIATGSLVAVGY